MPPETRPVRFSLLTLLSIVTVCGVLFALVAPWLNQEREAARRLQCQNNQKRIALAANAYYVDHRRYPRSARLSRAARSIGETKTITQLVPGAGTTANAAPYSFLVDLLPYLEQTALYDQIDFNKDAFRRINHPVSEAAIPVFSCPSFYGPIATVDRQNSYSAAIKPALTQYKTLSATTLVVLDDSEAISLADGKSSAGNDSAGGAIHPYSNVRALPATSQTALVCETREDDLSVWFDGSTAGLFGLDAPAPAGAVTLNNVHQPDPLDPAGYPYAPAVFGGKTMRWGPSSFHAGFVIHAFADTNTREITNDISSEIYESAGS